MWDSASNRMYTFPASVGPAPSAGDAGMRLSASPMKIISRVFILGWCGFSSVPIFGKRVMFVDFGYHDGLVVALALRICVVERGGQCVLRVQSRCLGAWSVSIN